MPTYEIAQRPGFSDQNGRPYLGFDTVGSGAQTQHRLRLHLRTWPWLGRHGAQLYRWHRFLQGFRADQVGADETLAAALARLGFSDRFRDSFLYPMWALMCTCRYDHLDAFPARPVLELAQNFAGSFATRRFKGGTQALEQRLLQRVHTTALGCTVSRIEQRGDGLRLHTSQDAEPASFSHVILATDPHSTMGLLENGPLAADRAMIAQVPSHETKMILHTDTAALPCALRAPVNLHYDAQRRRSSATLWMNPIEHAPLGKTVLQSWDPMTPPAPDSVIAQRTFHRALMTCASQQAMAQLRSSMRAASSRRVWYVGSYVCDGVPLLENGVQSARLVAGLLRERYPAQSTARNASAARTNSAVIPASSGECAPSGTIVS
ncbi:MAG: FAD-dependent oxidoreductase, partial [Gammaproteobacteria bacterium]